MSDRDLADLDDGILTTVQLGLLSEAERSKSSARRSRDLEITSTRDEILRRAVYDAVVGLAETVSEKALKKQLPFLHCSSWDEVVEERFLGKPRLCGFPTCGESIVVQPKKQQYHIDRHARKIYEHRVESDMYCSRSCMLRSASVRSQLVDEPLWLSGDISRRMRVSYTIEKPLEEKKARKNEIEVVRVVEQKLSDLRIREGDSSTESEAEADYYVDNETDVKGYLESVSNIIGADDEDEERIGKDKAEEERISKSPKVSPPKAELPTKRADTTPKADPSPKSLPSKSKTIKPLSPPVNPRLPDPQMSSTHRSFTSAELEKLSRLRQKNANRSAKKPIVIETPPAPTSAAPIENPSSQRTFVANNASTAATSPSTEKIVVEVYELFRGWMTSRTRQLLRSGGLCVSNSTDEIMKQFYHLANDSAVDTNEILLPHVDSVDVQKRRLHIFIDSVKKPLYAYQKELEFSFSEFNWLFIIAATFSLEPTTITNFKNDVLKLLCAILLKLISMLDTAVEDAVFPGSQPSEKFARCLDNMGLNFRSFSELVSRILEEDSNQAK